MEILAFMAILAPAVIWVVLFILAIVGIAKLSKQDLTPSDVKLGTIMPHFAFGWPIGLIIYFASTKKKVENNPELYQVAQNSNVIGIVGSIVYYTIVVVVFFSAFIPVIEKHAKEIETKQKPSSGISIMENKETPKPVEMPKSENAKTFEASTFAVDMECKGEIKKQSQKEINTTMGICLDLDNGSFVAAETVVFMDGATVDNELVLNSTMDGFFQGSGYNKTSTDKVSPSEIIAEGEGHGQKVMVKFLSKNLPDNRIAVYQMAVSKIGGVDKAIFDNFVNSFRLK